MNNLHIEMEHYGADVLNYTLTRNQKGRWIVDLRGASNGDITEAVRVAVAIEAQIGENEQETCCHTA